MINLEAKTEKLYNIVNIPPVESVSLKADRESPAELSTVETVMFTAEAAGGTGNYEYQFRMYSSSSLFWEVVQEYSDDNTYYWTPDQADAYWIAVWARNAVSSVNFEAKTERIFRIMGDDRYTFFRNICKT